jgi:LEA14-like dessication related protein
MLRTIRIAIVLPLAMLACACSSIQKPTATFESAHVGEVTPEGLTLNFQLGLKNPNAFALPVGDADYTFAVSGVEILEGEAKPAGTLPANGSTSVTLPVKVTFSKLLEARDAIAKSGGNIPYRFTGGLSVGEGGGVGALVGKSARIPLEYEGKLPLADLLKDPAILLRSPAARELAQKVLGGMMGH